MSFILDDKEDYIPVITKKQTARVNIREILYIETQLRVVYLHTSNRVYKFYGKLDDVLIYLNSNFYRCHKSCILNFEKIIRMENGIFYFHGGMTLQVGQNSYYQAIRHYRKYLKQNAKGSTDIV